MMSDTTSPSGIRSTKKDLSVPMTREGMLMVLGARFIQELERVAGFEVTDEILWGVLKRGGYVEDPYLHHSDGTVERLTIG